MIQVLFGVERHMDGGAQGCEGTRVPCQVFEEAVCINCVHRAWVLVAKRV